MFSLCSYDKWLCLEPDKFRHQCSGTILETWTHTILRSAGIDFNETKCGGDNNALFHAIRLGRADVVRLILADAIRADPFKPFGVYFDTHLHESSAESNLRVGLNHRRKTAMVNAIELCINQGHRDIFRQLLQFQNSEALRMGVVYPVNFAGAVTFSSIFRFLVSKIFESSVGLQEYFPEIIKHSRLSSVLGQSNKESISAHRRPFNWFFRSSVDVRYNISDGRLNYSLLYMTVIAKAPHRDINFA